MVFISIQTMAVSQRRRIPYLITIADRGGISKKHFLFNPEIVIPKKIYEFKKIDRFQLLAAPLFCDIADELIEIFTNNKLVFSDLDQFKLLKSQFKNINYNFEIRPILLWKKTNEKFIDHINNAVLSLEKNSIDTMDFSAKYTDLMMDWYHQKSLIKNKLNTEKSLSSSQDLSSYQMASGVYFFMNDSDEVIYVGKAKNIRKRLQSHFSNQEKRYIDYSKVNRITVEYTGNDVIAQLVETEHIKSIKPLYNTQQIDDAQPFIINLGKTANGIFKLKVTRKDIEDNLPERYYNRDSVKQTLQHFCEEHDLCRKHCGLESIKGPCSKYRVNNKMCVCSGGESIDHYNRRFTHGFQRLKNRKSRRIYKLKGRNVREDAFVYIVNGIYEGYGFIPKDDPIETVGDILGYLKTGTNSYETSRIVNHLYKNVSNENVIDF